jgi:hypothetical protein
MAGERVLTAAYLVGAPCLLVGCAGATARGWSVLGHLAVAPGSALAGLAVQLAALHDLRLLDPIGYAAPRPSRMPLALWVSVDVGAGLANAQVQVLRQLVFGCCLI